MSTQSGHRPARTIHQIGDLIGDGVESHERHFSAALLRLCAPSGLSEPEWKIRFGTATLARFRYATGLKRSGTGVGSALTHDRAARIIIIAARDEERQTLGAFAESHQHG